MYDLLSPLYIHTAPSGIFISLVSLADLVLLKPFPFKAAIRIFTREKLSRKEKNLLHLSHRDYLTASNLIHSVNRIPDLTALTNLYLKKHIQI